MNFWKWFAAILVVLNVALCLFVLLRNVGPTRHYSYYERPDEFIIRKLNFSDSQVHEYRKMRNSHHDSMMLLREEGRELRNDLFSNLKTSAGNYQLVDSLSTVIGDRQKLIEMVTYRHFQQVRQLCTEQQKRLFDDIIDEVLHRMAGPPAESPHPPPPGGDQNHPPPGDDPSHS